MHLTRRRAAVLGAMAGVSLAVAITARKSLNGASSRRVLILRPAEEKPPLLRRIAEAMQPVEPPQPPPPVRFTAGDASPKALADFAGEGVILNLWATWCAPCDAELPSLDALAARLAAENIVVLPLSSDSGGAAAVAAYYKSHGIAHLGVWLDPDGAALHALGARGIPTTLILDRQGRERARVEGGVDWGSADAAPLIRKLVG